MQISIGNEKSLGVKVGDFLDDSREFCYLDIWIAGEKITLTDNIAYIAAVKNAAKDDFDREFDLRSFEKYFFGKSLLEIHNFIVSTRHAESPNYALENDNLFKLHQIFDWGPNTDDVLCFMIFHAGETYITLEFIRGSDLLCGGNRIFTLRIEEIFYKQFLKLLIESLSRLS